MKTELAKRVLTMRRLRQEITKVKVERLLKIDHEIKKREVALMDLRKLWDRTSEEQGEHLGDVAYEIAEVVDAIEALEKERNALAE